MAKYSLVQNKEFKQKWWLVFILSILNLFAVGILLVGMMMMKLYHMKNFAVFAVIKDFIALEIVAQFDDIFFNIYNSSNLS